MNEVLQNIMTRRSIRKYSDTPISDEILLQIAQAGLYAPNAGSGQRAMMVVSTNKQVNQNLGKYNYAAFQEDFKGRLNSHVSAEQPSVLDDPSIRDGFYGAPIIITLFAPANFLYSREDCCMMAENMMLVANSLGVGSCYIARAEKTFGTEYGKSLINTWNIPEKYMAFGHVLLGYAQKKQTNVKPRRDGRIIFCREEIN